MRVLLRLLLALGIGGWLASWLVRCVRLMTQPDYFEGKIVLITGASRGIGRELALAFAERGAHLALAARSQDQLLAVASECGARRLGVQTLTVPTDVTDEAQLQRLVRAVLDRYGRIDILVNNAGILQGGALLDIGPDSIRKHLEVNVLAAMRLTQLVLPYMLQQNSGHIVNLASEAGRVAVPFMIPYSVTKHALIAFGDGLRRELVGTGVHVLTVSPSFTDTDLIAEASKAWRRMGFRMLTAGFVAQRTLAGIVTGTHEVRFGLLERFGGWVNSSFPRLVDLYWLVLAPRNLREIVSRQKTE